MTTANDREPGHPLLGAAQPEVDAIRQSPEVREAVLAGVAVAGGAVRQVFGGGAAVALTGAVEALARKATDAMSSDSRQAA